MKTRAFSRIACAATAAVVLLAWSAGVAGAESKSAQDPPRRDEFGVVPEDATDKDLLLPDPVLDRNWPGPRPGLGDADPGYIAPDEGELDPFRVEEAPPPLPAPAAPDAEGEQEKVPTRPLRPLIGPDGKIDSGSPVPEAEPGDLDFLELDEAERNEMEEEESRPSPLEHDDSEFNDEMGDPGDW
ncbi:MAG: hypothetical protein ABR538_18355 [Candidatus Binatia bacterium]